MTREQSRVVRPVKPKLKLGTASYLRLCTGYSSHLSELGQLLICALIEVLSGPPSCIRLPGQAVKPSFPGPKDPKDPKSNTEKCQSRGRRGSVLNHQWSPHLDSSA